MKKAALHSFIFCITIIPFLYLFQYIVDTGLRKSKNDIYIDWNNIYNSKINADLVVMGHSRAVTMVSPRILDSVLNLNSYNLGIRVYSFCMQYARFRIYLQHNRKPRYVIQNADLSLFKQNPKLFEHYQFLPYLFDTIIVNNTKGYIGELSAADLYIPMFKYNGESGIISEGIKSFFGKSHAKPKKYKGYIPDEHEWDSLAFEDFKLDRNMDEDLLSTDIDDHTKQQLINYIKYCNDNNIKLIFEFAPFYYEGLNMMKNQKETMDTLTNLLRRYNVPFLDYSKDSLSYNKKYFYNSMHLNKLGSEIFTRKLANDLKKYVQ